MSFGQSRPRKVMLVELPVFERITPLVSGYLQAYASTDEVVAGEYQFARYTASVRTPLKTVAGALTDSAADVYAFSCYVWNMGLVRSAVAALRRARPCARIILGGPQVMHHGNRYLTPADELTAICNGEGEITFTKYLRALTEPQPDLRTVNGVTFYQDGELITTAGQPRIKNLEDIPSPFLTGLFDADYSISILETNRGCPFRCGFCYWGAATNDRVYKFDEQRIRDEIARIAASGVLFLYIADANWGMLGRDVDISRHIAECARQHGFPRIIYFSAAKNKPQAVTKITSIFQEAGLVTSQPVSLQTLEPASLALISRSNIKLSAFAAVQEDLRAKRISSFIELIWPLPGETLESFKRGIEILCEKDAQTIIVYPHLLLNNTPLYHESDALHLVTRPAGGDIAEARAVIATEQVPEEDFAQGMRFFYAVHALHNTRSLRAVSHYLVRHSLASYAGLIDEFVRFWRELPTGDPVVSYVERSIGDGDYYDVNNYGLFIHLVLHEQRSLFADHLRRFVKSQPWWSDDRVRVLFEIDTLNRPYIYSNTPLDSHDDELESLELLDRAGRGYVVRVPPACLPGLTGSVNMELVPADGVFIIDHKRLQYPFMTGQSRDHNGSYCHGMIEKIENIMPLWRAACAAG
jgi:tRNA A37 methylthiotransferase MiaB